MTFNISMSSLCTTTKTFYTTVRKVIRQMTGTADQTSSIVQLPQNTMKITRNTAINFHKSDTSFHQ